MVTPSRVVTAVDSPFCTATNRQVLLPLHFAGRDGLTRRAGGGGGGGGGREEETGGQERDQERENVVNTLL